MTRETHNHGSSRLARITAFAGLLSAIVILFTVIHEADARERIPGPTITPPNAPLALARHGGPGVELLHQSRLEETAVSHPESSTGLPAAPAADPQVRVMYNYRFELSGCDAVARMVTCHITVTSLQGDRRLMIGGFSYLSTQAEGIRSVAYTTDGIDHFAAEASLGSRTQPGAVTASLIHGQPMAATVVFKDIPAGTSAFTALRVAFGSDRREFLVPFDPVSIR